MFIQGDWRSDRLVSTSCRIRQVICSLISNHDRAIVGTKEFIAKARWFRKAFGGGVRQSGPLAAAADYAITHHFPRLAATHALASRLAEGLEDLGCHILAKVDTNMVHFPLLPSHANVIISNDLSSRYSSILHL